MVDDTAYPARLTLPRWSGPVPDLPRARQWVLAAGGCSSDDTAAPDNAADDHAADETADCALPTWRSSTGTAVVTSPAELADVLTGARLGTRVAICGTEASAAALVATATGAGLLRDEIVVHTHGAGGRSLYCPACGVTTAQSPERCAGCGAVLLPHQHFARRRGAYLSTPTAQVSDQQRAAATD